MLEKKTAMVCVALGAMLSTARADNEGDSESKPAAGGKATTADGAEQLTLPKGRLLLDAFFGINLSTDQVLKPFSLSPDVWYGATDEITVGLVHSAVGRSGFIGIGVNDSLCLAGTADGCADLYSGVGVDVRYKLKSAMNGVLALAVDGGVYALHLTDPTVIAVKLGVSARWRQGPLAIELQPNVFVGATERNDLTNADTLNLPVTALYTIAPKLDVGGQLGFLVPFESTADTYAILLAFGGFYQVNESLNLNLAFSLPNLVGGRAGTGIDARTLMLGGTYAF
jgi:hypothetical protein